MIPHLQGMGGTPTFSWLLKMEVQAIFPNWSVTHGGLHALAVRELLPDTRKDNHAPPL